MFDPYEHPLPKRRRRMALVSASAGSVGSIPDDILFYEILMLLPVRCLVRVQSVCKLWRATITSAQFSRRHLEHSKSRSSIVLVPRKYHKDPKVGLRGVAFYRFEPERSKVAELIVEKIYPSGIPMFTLPLHCDGLILIPCSFGRIFVCNPATREFIELPPGSHNVTGDCRVAFGFDPSSGKYKVARHFIRSYSENLQADGEGGTVKYSAGHEVLTLGDGEENWKWKATRDPPYAINARTPICLPGFFYWSALHSSTGHGNQKVSSHVILRFNLHDKMFTVHPNPPCRGFLSNSDMLCELGGKLCYIHSASPLDATIWLADDGPNLVWSLQCRISLPVPMRFRLHCCACPLVDQDKIFLSIDASYLLRCNMRDGSLEEIVDMARDMKYDRRGIKFSTGELPVAHYMLRCVESLVRIRPVDNEQL